MWLFSKRTKDEDYEQILSDLSLSVQKRQSRLADLRLRERRSTLLVTSYAIAGWIIYVSLWYLRLLPVGRRNYGVKKALLAAPVLIGPILILFTRRIVQIWYTRKGDAEEKQLQTLLKEQRTKVEEIKKKTNYYTTRSLLDRYDDTAADSPLRRRSIVPNAPPPQSLPGTPLRQSNSVSAGPRGRGQGVQSQLTTPIQTPLQPGRKHWYDKLADALLGDDEDEGVKVASTRYALICEKCFAHNGLVRESMWEDAQYVCPKCGHFNASARSKKHPPTSASAASSPDTTMFLTPPSPSLPRSPDQTTATLLEGNTRKRPGSAGSDGVEDEMAEGPSLMEVDNM